ncbi:fatty acid desaturase family protein [Nocardia asteroides]|uniref:fatty acid desaturase family protein n=1 Tax=Nocardia asteroides TaxID=1824 RepID=UPI001E349D4E|nr:fatty acid desaturase [Nocardia asteroides]UGT56971.1 fatty acid desaturase [Nocardia asteroides]
MSVTDTASLKAEAQRLRRAPEFRSAIEEFDAASRRKVYGLNLLFAATIVAFFAAGQTWWMAMICTLINGFLALPYLRVFIHSEAHWGLGRTTWQTRYLRYVAFAPYQVPFEAYRLGHFAHHSYDNDVPERGLARDRQSTYLYSTAGKPVNFLIWAAHYLFVYQYFHQIKLVARKASRRKLAEFGAQLALVIAIDVALLVLAPRFALMVFVPSLLIAWIGSAIVLYMMHDVVKSEAVHHHSVNSYAKFFNSFGDNDGLHVVHSLLPFLHPYHAPAIDAMIKDELHADQVVTGHYVTEFAKRRLGMAGAAR